MNCKPLVALMVCCVGVAHARAQSPASGQLLVLAKSDRTLSVVNPATLQVVGKVPSGPDPHEVVVSTDGRVAYISNYNGGNNIITPVDLGTMKNLAPIDLGPLRAPHGLAFAGGKLWFTAEAAKVVGSYDPASAKVDWVLGTGQNRTHMIFVSPDLGWMVTSNVSSATMTFIDKVAGGGRGGSGGPADWNATVVPVGRGAEGFDVSPDGREIWAANAQDGTISVIDVATKRVTQTLAAGVNGANRLKFTPDGKLVFVSTLAGTDLIILDTASKKEAKRLPVGRAAGIQMQPDGARAYVACTPEDYVAVVDLKTLAVVGRIDAGRQPDGLAWVGRR
jgi:YVTN family beta-propeller protein